jgi:TetR/AcrR family transcriptional regulator
VLTEENALLPDDYAELLQQRDRFEIALRDLVRAGIADGSIVPCDPKLTVFTILGAVHWVSKWFNQSGAWSADAVSTALTDLLDRMVSATPVVALSTDIRHQK